MTTTELNLENGKIWAYSINRKGKVSQCGCVVSQEEADAMFASGEARWRRKPVVEVNPHAELIAAIKRGDARSKFSDAEITAAVRAGIVSESDAMNQDM